MTRIFTLIIALFVTAFISIADNYIESYNVLSNGYSNDIRDVQIIRPINGGTVIIPVFDESCPEELKAPFSYACKIVEEYMPPCLPLKVKVSWGRINGSSANSISKVLSRSKENFGACLQFKNVQMSVIKGVILSELCHNSTITYLDSVPDLEFLTKDPDIEIIYNSQKLDELSFSLEANPGEKYDFVSVVVRDLLIGLGISSSYRYNPVTNELLDPSQELTPFEDLINKALGNDNDPKARLVKATSGELFLGKYNIRNLKLYAPSTWRNGYSLNYFIPHDDYCISQILSYDFCKGMVTRSLADKHSNDIFYDLLGWIPNYTSSTSSPSSYASGSTSLLMPYNGSISLNNTLGVSAIVNSDPQPRNVRILNEYGNEELKSYIDSFHPFQYTGDDIPEDGISISVLKKDGTWDLVCYTSIVRKGEPINMYEFTFHYDESQYARTLDGYLRARITTKDHVNGSVTEYNSKFFVIDYLPQKVNLSYAYNNSPDTRVATSNNTVKIYFSNTEGISRLILEKLRQGSRVPSKIEILDLKKGYYETTIDKTTTFTAVGYNDNGTSRGVPITIMPLSNALTLDFILKDNIIYIQSNNQSDIEYNYRIDTMGIIPLIETQIGSTNGTIDVSTLSKGTYVLTIQDNQGLTNSFKFKK